MVFGKAFFKSLFGKAFLLENNFLMFFGKAFKKSLFGKAFLLENNFLMVFGKAFFKSLIMVHEPCFYIIFWWFVEYKCINYGNC